MNQIITPEELEAVKGWIKIFPKTRGPKSWQTRLTNAWMTGNYYGVDLDISSNLQCIRNRPISPNLPNGIAGRIKVLASLAKAETK